MTFLWRDMSPESAKSPSLLGQIGETSGPVEKRELWPLARLRDSDIWYRTFRLADRARFSYHFAWPLEGARRGEPEEVRVGNVSYDIFIDALNPRRYDVRWTDHGAAIRTSYGEGSRAPPEGSIMTRRPDARHGKVHSIQLESPRSGGGRFVWIYTPPGADGGCEQCDLLVLFDAAEFLSGVPTPTILDNLQAEGVIGPVVAVFIGDAPALGRTSDLRPEPRLSRFLRDDLLPGVRRQYRFTREPRRTVIGGSSLGALAAAYAALMNRDLFGNVISLSGSFWWWPGFNARSSDGTLLNSESGWLAHEYADDTNFSGAFYMDVGTWEGAVMLLPNRFMRDVLAAKGCMFEYREFVGGHDPVAWRAGLAEGLVELLGKTR